MLSKFSIRASFQSPNALAVDRVALRLRQDTKGPSDSRIYVISSATPREGKTLISRMLAQSAARHQEGDVLWVDAGITPVPGERSAGFSDLLGGATLESLAKATTQPHYWQLSRGDGYHASQLFQGGRLRAALERMRTRFSLTIIDAPELAACGALLALADQVILVVDAQRTTGHVAQQALENAMNLAGVGQERIAGVIINRQTRGLFSLLGG